MEDKFLIDTHCHLHDREFFSAELAEKMLGRAAKRGVRQVICAGTSVEDSIKAHEFAEEHWGVFWAYGVHPEGAEKYLSANIRDLEARKGDLERLIKKKTDIKLVAIGEVGLDYHYEPFNREAQIRLFEEMLQLARDLGLPVIFHIREAFADFFPIVDNFSGISGVVHSFTDNKRNLKKVLERGFYVGVNGMATYTTLSVPPLERILLETDAPFLTPTPNRGKINEPSYILDIASFLAEKFGVEIDEIGRQTTKNARELFGLPDTVICEEK